MKYPPHLVRLIRLLRKLPGVGSKSATRFAFEMLNWERSSLSEISDAIRKIPELLLRCSTCGCLNHSPSVCVFCDTTVRDSDVLCVTASLRDVYAIEGTNHYKGLYHVLGGLFSPFDEINRESFNMDSLKLRMTTLPLREVIIAFDSTVEGDATALFLKEELAPFKVNLSRLNFEFPFNSALDYIDSEILGRAIVDRQGF